MIRFEDVSVRFRNGTWGLREVTANIEKGEFTFLTGPTGEGKTTFLRLIYRDLLPTSGRVVFGGEDIRKVRLGRVPFLRRKIGVVFQDFRLLPGRTAWENVAFALQAMGQAKAEIRLRVPELLEQVGLADKANCYPSQLSSGEQQRVCIARALINRPVVLLADEPTGNLDPDTSWEIVQLLGRINVLGATTIVATHDKYIVDRMQRRVVTIADGRIVRDEQQAGYELA